MSNTVASRLNDLHPQIAKLWALGESFQRELVIALAEQVRGIDVQTTVTIRRTA